jgi:hypothetical protein
MLINLTFGLLVQLERYNVHNLIKNRERHDIKYLCIISYDYI